MFYTMIGISKLYCGTVEVSDPLRYGRQSQALPSRLLQFSADKKPVVVWNVTRRCNLRCVHCYARAGQEADPVELTTEQGLGLLDDLGEFGAPVVLFSGGEPLLREDLPVLIEQAVRRNLRAVLSTNGTLLDARRADELAGLGVAYVGVSLDGMASLNDELRGQRGAFARALGGIRSCKRAGVKVGLRFTMNRRNIADIPDIFKLVVDEDIERVCFYHLVYAGRASGLIDEDLDHDRTRSVVDLIIDQTAGLHRQGRPLEVLTVDNHTDGPYLYLRMVRENNLRAEQVRDLLRMNGGNSSGVGIGCVGWDGRVHADQFWRHYSFGNVAERKFSEIWTDTGELLMARLKNRKRFLEGRCGVCAFQDLCNGNLRVRAEAVSGHIWAPDPACYLTDEEIGINCE